MQRLKKTHIKRIYSDIAMRQLLQNTNQYSLSVTITMRQKKIKRKINKLIIIILIENIKKQFLTMIYVHLIRINASIEKQHTK